MDRTEYPSANWNPIAGGPHPPGNVAGTGELVGMGCGYTQFSGAAGGGGEVAGVGIEPFGAEGPNCYRGTGVVPIFEGQIDTSSLVGGEYTLTLIPGAGTNVLWGNVDCTQTVPNFATAADVTTGDTITFWFHLDDPFIQSWTSVAPHGNNNLDCDCDGTLDVGACDLAIQLDDSDGVDSECRFFPVTPHVIRVEMSGFGGGCAPPAITGTVQAVDLNTAATFDGITLLTDNGGGSYTLDITFDPALPSAAPFPAIQGCYEIDLAPNIACLIGDTDMRFKVVLGDVNNDVRTLLNDFAWVKSVQPAFSIDVCDPIDVRKDINRDGNILLSDAVLIKLNNNNGLGMVCP